jgi:MoaA/NifB/PqqE/SkfB family radical SAM enzyme
MQRDDYFAMIRCVREKHIWVRTTTNASLLRLKDNYRKMIDADVNELQISLDGASKEIYEGIRRGANYERVMSNIALINRYARERGVDRTKMWTVVQQANLHELEALVDLAAELGFSNQVFALELTDFGLARWHEINAAASTEQNLDIDFLLGLMNRGKERGVRVRFWNTTSKYSTESPEMLCPWPFERAYISSDQRVVPCCFIGAPDVAEIGRRGCYRDKENLPRDRLAEYAAKLRRGCLSLLRHGAGAIRRHAPAPTRKPHHVSGCVSRHRAFAARRGSTPVFAHHAASSPYR